MNKNNHNFTSVILRIYNINEFFILISSPRVW